jgi:hypothetical protein
MRLHISHKKKYVLQTFPKSGCSSLQTMFEYLERDQYIPRQLHLWPQHCDERQLRLQHFLNLPSMYFHYETIDLKDAVSVLNYDYSSLKDYFVISVVRNTYDRVISMYFNRFLGVEPSTLFGTTCKSIIGKGESFNEFLKWLGEHEYNINGDHHFNVQYLFEPSVFKVDKYISLDKIDEVLPELYETKFFMNKDRVKGILQIKENVLLKNNYDIDIKLDDYNFKEDSLNLDIIKNGVPHKELMLTDESIYMIKELYKEEIDYHQFEVN